MENPEGNHRPLASPEKGNGNVPRSLRSLKGVDQLRARICEQVRSADLEMVSAATGASASDHAPKPSGNGSVQKPEETWSREIEFVPNRAYHAASDAQFMISESDRPEPSQGGNGKLYEGLPPHLARLCAEPLLSAETECLLFRRLNYLKFRAHTLQQSVNRASPNQGGILLIEELLQEAATIRDRIIKANMRLVISIVKKFVGPQHSFDDLLSEGAMGLMHAVDKFDWDRGFRFSTYAYRAIARNIYHVVFECNRENARFVSGLDDVLFLTPDEHGVGWMSEDRWKLLRLHMKGLLGRLDRREQFIIRSRFALGAHRNVRTLQSLANRLGISKERVRQLEQRAVEKLRKMAEQEGLTDFRDAIAVAQELSVSGEEGAVSAEESSDL